MKANNVLVNLLFVFLIIVVLALAVPQGVKLAEGSSKVLDTIPYPPPETPVPVIITPTITISVLPTAVVSPTAKVSDNKWLIYDDKDAGFSISYPSSAVLSLSQDINNKYKTVNIAFINVGTSGGYQGMVIDVIDNPSGESPEAIVEKIYGNSPTKPSLDVIKSSLKSVEAKSAVGWKITIPPTNTELTILVPLNNKYLLLAPVHGPAVANVDPEALGVFYEIVGTLNLAP